jgi:hypothetical protein
MSDWAPTSEPVHSAAKSVEPVCPHQPLEWRTMSKSNDTTKLGHAKPENRVLADSELAAVTGGRIATIHPAKVELVNIKLTY